MRKLISVLMVCFLCFGCLTTTQLQAATSYENDMRAVWISTVYNLDYPSTKNNAAAQKQEFTEKLDQLQAIGINTVFIQVRPKADALYASTINPWSDVLTGTQGKSPGYDPLAFMIDEAHKRGMELHAWLNPYRVTTSGTDLNALSAMHPARLNPSWVFSYNNALYYNPEVEGVKQHIVDTVKEIAMNYDVDGIHFDDYFYPSNYPLPTGESKDGAVANSRRWAVNDMVQRVSNTIKAVNTSSKKSIQFGISPPGIWKNSSSDPTGSATAGREAYYAVFADTRTWIKNNWIDYIAPQIYWQIGHSKADYETLVKWWSNEVSGTNVKLYIGQGIYTDSVAKEIDTQLALNQQYPLVKGSIYFSLKDLLNNRQNCKTKITNFYSNNPTTNTPNQNTGNNTITTPPNQDSNINTQPNTGSGSNTTASSSAIGKKGVVTAASLNIRSGARIDREIITKVSSGTTLSILDVLGDWYKVKLASGTVGWASASYIKVSTVSEGTSSGTNSSATQPGGSQTYPATGVVTATSLNIRSGARVDRELITKVAKGTKLNVLSKLNDWYKVRLASGTVGWASASYIQISSTSTGSSSGSTTTNKAFPRAAKVTATSLNVRAGARTDRALVATIKKGTQVTLLDQLGDWYKLRLSNGKVGWAVKKYLA